MKYKQETGIILSPYKDITHVVDGFPGHVEFPKDVIWALHQAQPGFIYCLAHTHPAGMADLSGEDMTTLQGWVRALYPFPVRMSTTTLWTNHRSLANHTFVTTTYLGLWESFEEWVIKGKRPEGREIKIIKEKSKLFTFPQGYIPEGLTPDQFQDYLRNERKKARITSWEALILNKTYEL